MSQGARVSVEHEFQGIAVSELAEAYGTPLYVYDADVLREQYRRLRLDAEILYSLKANPNVAICALFGQLGAGAETSSLAELAIAGWAGVPAERTAFLGPGKRRDELVACLDAGIGMIVCESLGELDLLDALAGERDATVPVMLRVNPAVSLKGARLTMGGKARQFGIDEEQLFADPALLDRWPSVAVTGVHVYLGTRILDEQVIAASTEQILDLADRLSAFLRFPLDVVDVGGGLGVAYFEKERDIDPDVLAGLLNPVFAAFRRGHPSARVVMELGRYLTAAAGCYVVRVGYVKSSQGQWFAVADGGSNHHSAAAGTGSFVPRNFPVSLLSRVGEALGQWTVTGPLCTPSDTLVREARLPTLRAGDLIGIWRSGAYGPTASPGLFLSHGHPAEVLLDHGRAYLVRARDTVTDLLRSQRLDPELLARSRPTEAAAAGTPSPATAD
jgi:diaminopimelate decarboxylase